MRSFPLARLSLRSRVSFAKPKAREVASIQYDTKQLTQTEEQIDALAARLWDLTDKELAEIRRSLQEQG